MNKKNKKYKHMYNQVQQVNYVDKDPFSPNYSKSSDTQK